MNAFSLEESFTEDGREYCFYRLMGVVVDKGYRRQGLGKTILEELFILHCF